MASSYNDSWIFQSGYSVRRSTLIKWQAFKWQMVGVSLGSCCFFVLLHESLLDRYTIPTYGRKIRTANRPKTPGELGSEVPILSISLRGFAKLLVIAFHCRLLQDFWSPHTWNIFWSVSALESRKLRTFAGVLDRFPPSSSTEPTNTSDVAFQNCNQGIHGIAWRCFFFFGSLKGDVKWCYTKLLTCITFFQRSGIFLELN